MRVFILLFLLLIIPYSKSSEWRPLKAIVINKDGMYHPEIQKALQFALKWLELAVRVKPLEKPFTLKDLKKEVPKYKNVEMVTVQTPDAVFGWNTNDARTDELLATADIVIVTLPANVDNFCEAFLQFAANGKPLQSGNNRPHAGILKLCNNRELRPGVDIKWFDVFRRELLHCLGYASILRKVSRPPSQEYQWKFADGSEQTAHRFFMHFGGPKAVEEVRKHFGCNESIVGVESDQPGHFLSEYIFGNELMTNNMNRVENMFSYISAAILEETHKGPDPWYQVDREFIKPEVDAYTTHKNAGCDFLRKSCFEYLEKAAKPFEVIYPFCTGKEGRDLCVKDNGVEMPYVCDVPPPNNYTLLAENLIKKPANSKFHLIEFRFCPVFHKFGSMTPEAEVVTCSE